MTADDVALLCRLSVRQIWKMLDSGDLPAPIYISPRAPRWTKEIIDQWLQDKLNAANKPASEPARPEPPFVMTKPDLVKTSSGWGTGAAA